MREEGLVIWEVLQELDVPMRKLSSQPETLLKITADPCGTVQPCSIHKSSASAEGIDYNNLQVATLDTNLTSSNPRRPIKSPKMHSPKLLLLATTCISSTAAANSNLRIVYRWSIPDDLHGIAAFKAENETRTLISINCSNTLSHGPFDSKPISINIKQEPLSPGDDEETTIPHPTGNITAGNQVFAIDGNEHDGKPTCGVAWSHHYVDVYCLMYSTITSASSPLEQLDPSEAEKCFGDDLASTALLRGESQADTSMARPASEWNHGGKLMKPLGYGVWVEVAGWVVILGAVGYFVRVGREG